MSGIKEFYVCCQSRRIFFLNAGAILTNENSICHLSNSLVVTLLPQVVNPNLRHIGENIFAVNYERIFLIGEGGVDILRCERHQAQTMGKFGIKIINVRMFQG